MSCQVAGADFYISCTVRKRAEHDKRETNAGTFEPPIPLQLAIQLPRCGISVRPQPSLLGELSRLCPSRYIVQDLMNGGDLRFHITRKTFSEEAIRFWIAELGCALRYIHQQNVVHRDVKPDNVLLDSDGHVHLADFVSTSFAARHCTY